MSFFFKKNVLTRFYASILSFRTSILKVPFPLETFLFNNLTISLIKLSWLEFFFTFERLLSF